MFAIENYINERSHLFAIVLSEVLNENAELAWDKEFLDQNTGQTSIKLVNAYVPDSNLIVDSIGRRTKKSMLQDFQFNRISYEKASVKRLYKLIELGVLEDFKEGEFEAIEQYILTNKNIYL